MDFIVSLPRIQNGHDVVDWLTKMAKSIPMKSTIIDKDLTYEFVNELF